MTETSCLIALTPPGDPVTGHVGPPSPACEVGCFCGCCALWAVVARTWTPADTSKPPMRVLSLVPLQVAAVPPLLHHCVGMRKSLTAGSRLDPSLPAGQAGRPAGDGLHHSIH